MEVKKKNQLNHEEKKKTSFKVPCRKFNPKNIKLKQTATMEQNQATNGRVMGEMDGRRHNVNVGGFGPFTFGLSGENLSVSLSQDAPLSVPNGAVRGCMRAFTWLSGDVALLPLKSQNHHHVRFYGPASVSCGLWRVGMRSTVYVGDICQDTSEVRRCSELWVTHKHIISLYSDLFELSFPKKLLGGL